MKQFLILVALFWSTFNHAENDVGAQEYSVGQLKNADFSSVEVEVEFKDDPMGIFEKIKMLKAHIKGDFGMVVKFIHYGAHQSVERGVDAIYIQVVGNATKQLALTNFDKTIELPGNWHPEKRVRVYYLEEDFTKNFVLKKYLVGEF